jgi:hypothetical protein
MYPVSRFASACTALLGIAFVTGCFDQTIDGDKITMTCSPWVEQVVIGLSIGAFVVAFVLRKRSITVPIAFIVVGLFGFLVLLPVAQLDNIVLDDEHYERNGGFSYFHRVHDEINFKQTKQIEIIQVKKKGRRGGTQNNYYFVVTDKVGSEPRELPIGDMARNMISEIADRARKQGVEVFNSSDLQLH